VIGLAGNSRRVRGQVRWATVESGKLDLPYLRGAIATGDAPMAKVGFFGPIVGDCQLLDGVFLAARKQRLLDSGVRFDPRFDFHLYDLDFSRTAVERGLKIGTWPLSVTHRSPGGFGNAGWQANAGRYLEKWGS
jgi:GT2 family glycosyltransferase